MTEELLSKHAELFSKVKVWDGFGIMVERYLIIIENNVWLMRSDPAHCDEVSMYGGKVFDNFGCDLKEAIPLDQLPIAVLKQIIVLAEEGI